MISIFCERIFPHITLGTMTESRPQWKMWLHEFLRQDYYDGNTQSTIGIIAEDAFNATKEYYRQRTDIANIVRDMTISVGYNLSNSTDGKNSSYRTVCDADGITTYILVEIDNTPNVNRENWFNRLGLLRNKHRVNVHFSVIVPLNEIAEDICKELFRIDIGSKIHHLHTYMSLVHPSAKNKNTTIC